MIEALALDAFAVFGLTYVITQGSIFDPLHDWVLTRSRFIGELIGCHVCLGTWLAGALALRELPDPVDVLVLAFGSLGGSIVLWAVRDRLNC